MLVYTISIHLKTTFVALLVGVALYSITENGLVTIILGFDIP